MRPQSGLLTLSQQLRVVHVHREGQSLAELASANSVTVSVIQNVMNRRHRLERVHNKPAKRRHLPLGDKLRLLHLSDTGMAPVRLYRNLVFLSVRCTISSLRRKYVMLWTGNVFPWTLVEHSKPNTWSWKLL